jgi:hypothetical protein
VASDPVANRQINRGARQSKARLGANVDRSLLPYHKGSSSENIGRCVILDASDWPYPTTVVHVQWASTRKWQEI